MSSQGGLALRSKDQVILMLDYNKLVADVVGPSAKDFWPDTVAPRHSGQINVLYVDGSVRSMLPDEVDPSIPGIHNEEWRPEKAPSI